VTPCNAVGWLGTDNSEVHGASIFRAKTSKLASVTAFMKENVIYMLSRMILGMYAFIQTQE